MGKENKVFELRDDQLEQISGGTITIAGGDLIDGFQQMIPPCGLMQPYNNHDCPLNIISSCDGCPGKPIT